MKRWFQSKTNMFNITTFIALAGVLLAYVEEIGLEPQTAAMIALGAKAFETIGNIYLRSITTKAIGK